MVQALVSDLARIPKVDVIVARDPGITFGPLPAEVHTVEPSRVWEDWRRLAVAADLVWPIAPETDGALEKVSALACAVPRRVLCSHPDALAIARSKRATAHHLAAQNVPIVSTLDSDEGSPPSETGWIAKPDDGAGCENTIFLADERALARWRMARPARPAVIQPFVPGPALSLSILAQDGVAWLLTCNRQHVELKGGKLSYRGGFVGGAEALRPHLEPLASRIVAALPGLWGYVGVDLIDGPQGPTVLEINPRLTTSYVGLSRSLGVNPAALILALLDQRLETLVRALSPKPIEITIPGLGAAA